MGLEFDLTVLIARLVWAQGPELQCLLEVKEDLS